MTRTLLAIAAALCTSTAAMAQLPSLPVPPPPPSPAQILAGQLAEGLYPDDRAPAARGPFTITVALPSPLEGASEEPLLRFLGDTLEAAVRERAPGLGSRLGSATGADDAENVAAEAIAVELSIARGHLAATATRRRLPTTVWERLKVPDGRLVATAFASVVIDLELRTLLGLGRRSVRLDRQRVVSVNAESDPRLLAAPILDIAIADLDGDRFPEVAFLYSTRVIAARWEAGGFSRIVAELDLNEVTEPNPARVRAPIGRIVVTTAADGRRVLVAASSDRARPVALALDDGAWTVVDAELASRWPLYGSGVARWVAASWPRGTDVWTGDLEEVGLAAVTRPVVGAVEGVYDLRAFPLRSAISPSWTPYLATADVGATLSVWSPPRPEVDRVDGAGVTWAIVDLDGDGTAELLSASPALAGPDTLTLYGGVGGPEAPTRLWRGRVPHPVTAMVGGDVDRDGYREIVVASWAEDRSQITIIVPREG